MHSQRISRNLRDVPNITQWLKKNNPNLPTPANQHSKDQVLIFEDSLLVHATTRTYFDKNTILTSK